MSAPTRPTPPDVRLGRAVRVVRSRGGTLSGRIDLRTVVVCLALLVVALGVTVVALTTGDYPLSVGQVLGALTGVEDGPVRTIVVEWRLPRALLALVVGVALGASGAIFQSITRNPLGSPDIIGFNTGAYTGALVVLMVIGGGYGGVTAGALVGGIGSAVLVYFLAYRRGVQGFRFVVVGIAISAMLAAVNAWLIVTADLESAMAATLWGAGSLNGTSWAQAGPATVLVVVLLVPMAALAPRMHLLELGDDAATALGLHAERTRLALVVVGVALVAVATAVAGPISFVALAAPQLARRLTRGAGVQVLPAAAMGAVLLAASDLVAQRLFAPTQLPVGVVTVVVGGAYLIWLLVREARR
ncbi:iron chelate uptake ABC transporter family permease subunit [Cellulosimicrobium arenosum]|uniref:Iron chelate uptake ABC transporter family permease subunit n=1 Tax=Cellulosimicrobium arenosum TaxID=2708133 RepID=A0A927J179_9MICO|nr:iron chelate uptake ABC transporter family permease subunit [Cellulosimicrobium arenosum]